MVEVFCEGDDVFLEVIKFDLGLIDEVEEEIWKLCWFDKFFGDFIEGSGVILFDLFGVLIDDGDEIIVGFCDGVILLGGYVFDFV